MSLSKRLSTLAVSISIAVALTAGGAPAATIHAAKAKITSVDARAIALKSYPGKILKEELETEGGGLRYSFDISRGGKTQEVSVDAMDGHVIEAPSGAGQR